MSFFVPCRLLLEWLVGVILLALVMRTWIVMGLIEPVVVAGKSMEPTICAGERLWVDRTVFHRRQPRRWEVVVARAPHDASQFCVKRIVGLPGEMMELSGGWLKIDGSVVPVPHGLHKGAKQSLRWWTRQIQLGKDDYFLLGDNGEISLDSRTWGPVGEKLLLGKPIGVR